MATATKVQNSTGDDKGMYYVRDKNFVEYPMLGVMYRDIVNENPVYTGETFRNDYTDFNGNPFVVPQLDTATSNLLLVASGLPGQDGAVTYQLVNATTGDALGSGLTGAIYLNDSMKGTPPIPLITTQSFFVYYNGDPAGSGQECGRIALNDFESEGNVSASLIGG